MHNEVINAHSWNMQTLLNIVEQSGIDTDMITSSRFVKFEDDHTAVFEIEQISSIDSYEIQKHNLFVSLDDRGLFKAEFE
jgi:hypothetical protein